ncbi:MAG: hypothetical protein HC789_14660 [Microcoleus sp. CSU_2_2]|nr:hypothetical protein [Microcoleus sp. CSU_2_2]
MKAEFYFDNRRYTCSLVQVDFVKELKIKNHQGFVLAVKQGQKIGLLGKTRQDAKKIDVSKPHFYNLIKAAMNALELESKNELILDRNRTIADAEAMIQQQGREIRVLNEQIRTLTDRVEELVVLQQQLPMQLIENEIIETEISQGLSQGIDRLSAAPELVMQLVEHQTRETDISQAIDQQFSEEAEDLLKQETDNKSEQTELLVVPDYRLAFQGIDDGLLESESELDVEVESADTSDEIVDLEVVDSEEEGEDRIELEVRSGDSQIKQLPKRASNRKMRKKS